jgi:hypothetical protein
MDVIDVIDVIATVIDKERGYVKFYQKSFWFLAFWPSGLLFSGAMRLS